MAATWEEGPEGGDGDFRGAGWGAQLWIQRAGFTGVHSTLVVLTVGITVTPCVPLSGDGSVITPGDRCLPDRASQEHC